MSLSRGQQVRVVLQSCVFYWVLLLARRHVPTGTPPPVGPSINWCESLLSANLISPPSLSASLSRLGLASSRLSTHIKRTPCVPPYMSPRPILKPRLELPTEEPPAEPFPFAACPSLLRTPRVHFPPTPTLTSTFTTHSSSAYDRTPVVVAPNTCALPGRHERELFIDNNTAGCERRGSEPPLATTTTHSRTRKPTPKGSYFHPCAYEACTPEPCPSSLWSSPGHSPPPPFPPPPLIPDTLHDLSSDSDSSSSDSQVSTPTDDELDVASHRPMSMLYPPTTNPASCTPPSPHHHHNMNVPVIPPHSYLSPEGLTSSYSNHYHLQSPATKERKAGKRSNNNSENNQPRSPKLGPRQDGIFKPDQQYHHHQQRSGFTFPSLDFEGCLGGF